MVFVKRSTALSTAFLLTAMPMAARAQTGLEDLVGARAGQAEGEIVRRGFRDTGGSKSDDRSYTNWWNSQTRQCVTISTMDGRYVSIEPTTPPDCGQSASVRPQPSRPSYSDNGGYERPSYRPDDRPPYRPSYRPDDRPSTLPGGGRPIVDGRTVNLGLVCFGDGSKDGLASGTTWTWNEDRERYEYGRTTELRTEVFDASLMVQTWDGGGRIRLPRSLIPPINSRGDNGWWDLYDVEVGPDTIRASYRLNGLNKPRMSIDRRSGRISIQGTASYGFQGRCDLIGSEERRF